MAGAGAAVFFFPSAAFGQNPTGQFGWHLVGFALLVGVSFAMAQWSVLKRLTGRYLGTNPFLVGLWIPASSVAIMAMLIPLWWVPGGFFFWFPWLLAQRIFPGVLVLAILQWLILRRITATGSKWVVLTIVGASVGATLGLFWPILLAPILLSPGPIEFIPFEVPWAFLTGGTIGLLQAGELSASIVAAIERMESS
ncbi:hypothetical protein [Ostreiculturibacter nitratireducens]|uniref:hypothetical protein n=1 Tax=Ostreiculturibacter nitratireducens TaxID=3075226 RepID=UPI0031B63EBA